MRVHCPISNPPTQGPSWDERWEGPDKGLITVWLKFIERARNEPDLVTAAKAGELPLTGLRGGVEKPIKTKGKLGALHYLAGWQALRGEDLDIDTEAVIQLTCTRTNVTVTFTGDTALLLASGAGDT